MKFKVRVSFILFSFLVFGCASKPVGSEAPYSVAQVDVAKFSKASDCCSARGDHWGIAAGGEGSAKAGAEMFQAGGNSVDAAVAVAFALAVERPHSDGIGGGGFMTLHLAGPTGGDFFVDFRESAPHAASKDMYLDSEGQVVPHLSQTGILSVGTPGFVAGLAQIHKKWGKLPWKKVMEPAIRLADQGFTVYPRLAEVIGEHAESLRKSPDTRKVFFPGGTAVVTGDKLVQRDLARTLEQIADGGPEVFYRGRLASKIVAFMKEKKGLVDGSDLEHYEVKFRQPLTFDWRGFHFVSAPPPSAGGVMLAQMLNVLGGFSLTYEAGNQTRYAHLLSEVMKHAYADRSRFIGDPDFFKAPYSSLMSPEYARTLRSRLNLSKNTPSQEVLPGGGIPEVHGTTQFSILDKEGNAVSSTLTINESFGSGMVVPGTGMFLNNEMDDFSVKPGAQNAYGLTGSDANAIAPGKRPVSSMMPTVVLKKGRPVLAIGGSGGSRIVSAVTQVILGDLILFPGDLKRALFASRMHQQWIPDRVDLESGFATSTWTELQLMGHEVSDPAWNPLVQAVSHDDKRPFAAVTDPRDWGGAIAE